MCLAAVFDGDLIRFPRYPYRQAVVFHRPALAAVTISGTLARLGRLGLDAATVAEIRRRAAPVMLRYNAVHWDWCHLGLADLLDAASSPIVPERLRRAMVGDAPEFYAWTMAIADLPVTGAHAADG